MAVEINVTTMETINPKTVYILKEPVNIISENDKIATNRQRITIFFKN